MSDARPSPSKLHLAALLAALVLYIALQVAPLLRSEGTGIPGFAARSNDFKHLYLGATLLRNGISPYDAAAMLTLAGERSRTDDPRFRTVLPYVYLPFTGVVLFPLSALPFAKAVIAFQFVNHAAILASIALLASLAPPPKRILAAAGLLAAMATSMALYRQNSAGQLNAILLLAYSFAAFAMTRVIPSAASGASAAFATLFKIVPGILLPWMLLRRRLAEAAAFCVAGIVLAALTFAVVSPKLYVEFLAQLPQMGFGRSTWSEFGQTFWRDPYNQSINATLHRLFVFREGTGITPWIAATPALANALTWAATLALGAGFVASALSRRPRAERASLACAICFGLLAPALMWDHYLVQALAPAALLWWNDSKRAEQLAIIAALVIAALPIPLDHDVFKSGFALLLGSTKLACPAILYALSLRQSLTSPAR